MSRPPPENRSNTATSQVRFQRDFKRQEEENEAFLNSDNVSSLTELTEKLAQETLSDIQIIVQEEFVMIGKTELDKLSGPKFTFALIIRNDLSYQAFLNEKPFSKDNFSHIISNTITNVTQVLNAIAVMKNAIDDKNLDSKSLLSLIKLFKDYISESEMDEAIEKKLLFLLEQMHLAIFPSNKRYSPALLAMASMWLSSSSSLYKQIIDEDILSLPSVRHLKRISKALSVECGLTSSAKAYLTSRGKNLSTFEKAVVLIFDEIYTAQRVEFQSGKLYGYENESVTKTLLCFMIKSVSGKYQDVVSLTPVSHMNSTFLKEMFDIAITALTDCDFDVVGMSGDNHSANRKFYTTELCLGKLDISISHPVLPNKKIFLLFDSVHNFKNIYNNFMNRQIFVCPPFKNEEIGSPSFRHLETLHNIEKGKPIKMAHKLTEKVLHPMSIEKTNVKLADAFFHESTIAALEFYSNNGFPEFKQTVPFMKLIRKLWNICNVKTPSAGKHKRDKSRDPIWNGDSENLKFLSDFVSWLEMWKKNSQIKETLTRETLIAIEQTCKALIGLANYLIEEKGFYYVLLGLAQSDPVEGRFGQYRQMSGANYYVSVRQVLDAEKSIRLKALAKYPDSFFDNIKNVCENSKEDCVEICNNSAIDIVAELNIEKLPLTCKDIGDENIIYYVSGYIGRSLIHGLPCSKCQQLVISSHNAPSVVISGGERDNPEDESRMRSFLEQLNRGGLSTPSDICYISCIYIWNLYFEIKENQDLKSKLFESENPMKTFCSALKIQIENDADAAVLFDQKCEDNHLFSNIMNKIAIKMFKIMTKNFVKEINETVYKCTKRPKSSDKNCCSSRKMLKLTSNSS